MNAVEQGLGEAEKLAGDGMALAEEAANFAIEYGPSVVGAILVLLIGLWIINKFVGFLRRSFEKRNMEPSLGSFLGSFASIALKGLLLLTVAGMVGIETTSFIAVLGAAGLAVGLALQGSLANFAGGVLILLFKPFRVGDWIEGAGVSGSVAEIAIFHTTLRTGDNKIIIVPNGKLSNDTITNVNREPTRRVDLVFGIGYGDDIDKAREVILGLIDADDRILKDPASQVIVSELADSSVNFTVRAWVNTPDYWGVRFAFIEGAKKAFDDQGISIPFPQRDIHVHQVA